MNKRKERGKKMVEADSRSPFDRPKPSRTQHRAVLIALEDEKSSRFYFESIKKLLRNSTMVVLADHIGSDPNSVVTAAKKVFEERKQLAKKDMYLAEFDSENVWIVFDTEGPQNHQRQQAARQALDRVHSLKFKHAISNPSFEFWLLLHFEYVVAPLRDGKTVLRRLAKHIPGYAKGAGCFDRTRSNLATAVDNAARIFAERGHEGASPCDIHPSTQVHKLVQDLIPNIVTSTRRTK